MPDASPTSTTHTTRTFLALAISNDASRALARVGARLAQALPSVRFVGLGGVHLTLAFLGELDDKQVAATREAAAACARAVAPFTLALGQVGMFGAAYAPRVLWVGVEGATDQLRASQRRLMAELDARCLPHDDKPFAAHLTLARLQRPLSADEQTRLHAIMGEPAPPNVAWQVDEIVVMASELRPDGARYTRLGGYPLVG